MFKLPRWSRHVYEGSSGFVGLLILCEVNNPSVLMSFTSSLLTAFTVLNSLVGSDPSMASFSRGFKQFCCDLVGMSEMSSVFLRKGRGGSGSTGATKGSLYLGTIGLVTLLDLNSAH